MNDSAFDAWAFRVVEHIDRRVPGWWSVSRIEIRFAELVGVRAFAERFWNGGSRRGASFYRRTRGARHQRLAALDRFTRGIEAKHLVGVVACAAVPALAWLLEQPRSAAALAGLNLIGHGYPILSMRWVRYRIHGLHRLSSPRRGSS